MAPSQQPLLQAYRVLACNGSQAARKQRFAQLAAELRDQMDTPKIVSRVSAGPGLGTRGEWWGRAVPDYFSPTTRGCAGTLGQPKFLGGTSVHVLACRDRPPAQSQGLLAPGAPQPMSSSGHLIRHCLLDVVSPASSLIVPPAGSTQDSLGMAVPSVSCALLKAVSEVLLLIHPCLMDISYVPTKILPAFGHFPAALIAADAL